VDIRNSKMDSDDEDDVPQLIDTENDVVVEETIETTRPKVPITIVTGKIRIMKMMAKLILLKGISVRERLRCSITY
jgi:hypothetical protein